jgi:hypothetical protein
LPTNHWSNCLRFRSPRWTPLSAPFCIIALWPQGVISDEDEQLIERLRKIGAVIDELPVWPFDSGTLRKFLTAYIIPIISSAGFPLAKFLLGLVKVQIPG